MYATPADMLLPLTAASGGPGSSLRKLTLDGSFWEIETTATPATTVDTSHRSWQFTAPRPRWFHPLQQFDGLCDLTVYPDKPLVELPAASLPVSLKYLTGQYLMITGDVLGSDAIPSTTQMSHDINHLGAQTCPLLQKLELRYSVISSPSILASSQLQQLTVVNSSLPGGCVAAAAAWPMLEGCCGCGQPLGGIHGNGGTQPLHLWQILRLSSSMMTATAL